MNKKVYRIVGKTSRSIIPLEVRAHLKIRKGSVVSYEIKDDDTAILRNEKICNKCGAENENTDTLIEFVKSLTQREQIRIGKYLSKRFSSR